MLEQLIKPYLDKFQEEKGFFTGDRVKRLYFKSHFDNKEVSEVMLKISLIESEALRTVMPDVHHLAWDITELNLDEALRNGGEDAVNQLMSLYKGSAKAEFLAFCSNYCNWHNSNAYPVYSTITISLIKQYLDFSLEESCHNYGYFKNIMEEVRRALGIEVLNYHEFDKFIWVYSDRLQQPEVIEEVKKALKVKRVNSSGEV